MHVEWKNVTDNPHVVEKIKTICKSVLRLQHQPEACASDLDDSSHVTCLQMTHRGLMQEEAQLRER